MKLYIIAILSILLLNCSEANTTATEWDNPNDPVANNSSDNSSSSVAKTSSSSSSSAPVSEESSSESSSPATSSSRAVSSVKTSSSVSTSSSASAVLPPLAARLDRIILEDLSLKIARDTLLSISQSRGGGALSFSEILATDNAEASISATGIITYTPNTDWVGKDSLLYVITDLQSKKDTGVIEITVNPVNDKPILALTKGDLDTIKMWEEDFFTSSLSFVQTNTPGGGSDEVNQSLQYLVSTNKSSAFTTAPALASSGKLSFALAANWNGDAKIYVRTLDNGGIANHGRDTSDLDSILLKVNAVNDAPVASEDEFTVLTDHHVEITHEQLLANDHDVDNANSELNVAGPTNIDVSTYYLHQTTTPTKNIFITPRQPNQPANISIRDTIQDPGLLTSKTNFTISYAWTPQLCSGAGFTCGTVTDSRGTPRTYRWAEFELIDGTKADWFVENLNYNSDINPVCPGAHGTTTGIPEFCGILGQLYTHEQAKTACPTGWRLPSDEDWKNLEVLAGVPLNELDATGPRGSDSLASEKLKSFAGWAEAVFPDSYGFARNLRNSMHLGISAAGIKYPSTFFYGLNDYGYYWSATASPTNGSSYTREFFYSTAANGLGTGIRRSQQDDTYYLSVRCMRDVP